MTRAGGGRLSRRVLWEPEGETPSGYPTLLADGRSCKLVTGIDDHSRFGHRRGRRRALGEGGVRGIHAAMRRYGVPSEVLTDDGKLITGRHTRPQPVAVCLNGSAATTASPPG